MVAARCRRPRQLIVKPPYPMKQGTMQTKIDFEGFSWFAILTAFWIFWLMGGFYRVDCALSIERACEIIKEEYAAKKKP
jgi:hypothetical protein